MVLRSEFGAELSAALTGADADRPVGLEIGGGASALMSPGADAAAADASAADAAAAVAADAAASSGGEVSGEDFFFFGFFSLTNGQNDKGAGREGA